MRTAFLATVAFIAGCAAAPSAESPSPGVRDASQLPRIFVDAYRDGDADKIASLFAPEATFIPLLPMPRFQGPDAVRAYYQRAISSNVSRSITPSNEAVQDYGDVIVRSADIVVDQEFSDGRRVAIPARVSFVYKRESGVWRIVHHHQSVRPAAPSTAPATAPTAR